jgi:predicted O-methyltransferase YrrM
VFDVVFLDAEKAGYERLFALARPKLDRGLELTSVLSRALE